MAFANPLTRLAYFLAVLSYGTLVQSANAENTDPFDDPAYTNAFDNLLLHSDDPEVSFRFAREAVKRGDLTGAISAFERILKLNPELANIKLELGILYLRVGANELAQHYITDALKTPGMPPAVRARAKTILKQAQKASSTSVFAFRFGAGIQTDENASAAPTSGEVLVGGQSAFLDEESLGKSDISYAFNAAIKHRLSFKNQSGNQLESALNFNSRRYSEHPTINSDFISIDTGPRFFFGDLLSPGWSARPFLETTQLRLDGTKYQEAISIGSNISRVFSPTNIGTINFKYSDNTFFDSDNRLASERSGSGFSLDANLSKALKTNFRIFGGAGISTRKAQVDYESRFVFRFNAGTSLSYKAPFGLKSRWNTSLSASYTDFEYQDVDPSISPDTVRDEHRAQINLSNFIAVNRNTYGTLSFFYTKNDSSLPNFIYDNSGANFTLWLSF